MKLFRGDNTTDLLMPDWKNVVLSNGPEGRLVSSFIPKINHTLSLGAEHIHVVDEETFIIDFGAIVTGFIDLSITASENQRVELLYSEDVDENYELNTDSTLAGFVGKQVTEGVIIDGGIEHRRGRNRRMPLNAAVGRIILSMPLPVIRFAMCS